MLSLQEESIMLRPRMDEALAQAIQRPLTFIIANAGYGKTQAVRTFLRQQDAHVLWIQLTESDNVGSRFWESLTHIIETDTPELAAELREFGFPDTNVRFKRYIGILKKIAKSDRLLYIVHDNFHVLTNRQVLDFFERCFYTVSPKVRRIIISRREPEINVVPLLSKGQVSMIGEDELRFTEGEIAEFFRWSALPPLPARELPAIRAETHGWALALRLLALALQRRPEQRQAALHTMRLNLFKLMEREAFEDFPERFRKLLVKLSLVANLPLAPLHELAGEDAALYDSNPRAAAFLWLDSITGHVQIHPLYLEFLRTKEDLLSAGEKRGVYRWAASWCAGNHFLLDAMEFYAKLKDYLGVQSVLLKYPLKIPADMAWYFLRILEGLDRYDPQDESPEGITLMMLQGVFVPRLLMELGRYGEAERRVHASLAKWSRADSPHVAMLAFSSYNNLGFLNMYTCTATRQYTFDGHFAKARECFGAQRVEAARGPYNSAEIDSYACLVGESAQREDLDRFLKAARAAVPCVADTLRGLYNGYDDLVACEIAFYRGQIGQAKLHAHRAIQTAHTNGQYGIEAFAQYYLMNAALAEGDYAAITGLLRQFRAWLEIPDFRNRQLLYDLFTGFFYGQIELPKLAAPWLLSGAAEDVEPGSLYRETIIRAKYLIVAGEYHKALGMLAKLEQEGPEKRFLFGELTRNLIIAVARRKSGDTQGAIAALERAWRLSFEGELEMMFILPGRNMHDLATAALKQGCAIPAVWLKSIDRKASGYAKKAVAIAAAYKRDNNIEDSILLTQRELQLLSDLYHGLSRTEIAATRYLSINTVKTALNMLYSKLGAENNVNAVRIAMEKKLIDR